MQKSWYKPLIPHAIAVGIFLVVTFVYCKPAFEHKTLNQNDGNQYKAMAQNSFEYKATHGHFPLWTEGMFSGMPAYQIAMDAPAFSPQYLIYDILTLWLPKPASFFFLGCICFYILTLAFRVNPYAGIVCALAYAYTTYNPTALVVGHETKIQAIQIMPAFLAGLLLLFEKRYWLGTATLALFTALFIAANHPQINYYGGIIAGFMTLAYVIRWVRAREYRRMATVAALAVVACGIGVASNAVVTWTTLDYAKASLRDGSALATPGGNVTNTGLSQDYALSYSMYKTEAFELLVPKIFGGGGNSLEAMIPQDDSKAIAALQSMPPQVGGFLERFLNYYWGGIGPSTGGPAYAGAVICFLALLAFFLLDGKHKWWILAASVFAICMSWGSYFVEFNGLLLKILPGYNKFRAPSLAIVIPNLLFCVLAALSLDKLLRIFPADRANVWKQYKKGLYGMAGIFAILLLCYISFDYTGLIDSRLQQVVTAQPPQVQEMAHTFLHELRADRQTIFFDSMVRSFLFIAAAAVIVSLWVKGRLKPLLSLGLVGALAVIDILALDTTYLNAESYQDDEEAETPFLPSPADQRIMRDSSYYRVFDLRGGSGGNITMSATAAYFHRTVAGYHPAKLSIYEDLLENQLEKYPNCLPVLNMLNTKYLLLPAASGRGDSSALNPGALGPVWFVNAVRPAAGPRAVMDALNNLDTKDTAIVFADDRFATAGKSAGGASEPTAQAPATDPTSLFAPATAGDTIFLTHNDNDEMIYHCASAGARFAVFSEVYYDRGWKAYIDDTEAPIVRTNYVLRGLWIPGGQHTLRFIFHPVSYYGGWAIQTGASLLLFVLLVIAGIRQWRPGVKRLP